MGSVLTLLLVVAGAAVVYRAARPRPVFVIEVDAGRSSITTGSVTASFARDVAEICARNQVEHARVRGVVQGKRIVLVFSSSIPPGCRQQIRNMWSVTGWKAPLA